MFSLKNYKILLEKATKRGYEVMPLSACKALGAKRSRLFLRHDVDYSLDMALKIGKINAGLGICGTFFVLSASPLYNLLSMRSQAVMASLIKLKQEIGWHVEFTLGTTTKESLLRDWGVFKSIAPLAIPLVAWHNPANECLEEANRIAAETGVLRSVYAPPFISKDVVYLSDSNRRNSFGDLTAKLDLAKLPCVHLLLHPLNWVVGGDNMHEILTGAWEKKLIELDKEFSVNPNWRGKIK